MPAGSLAAVTPAAVDVGVAVVLVAFAAWGARRGALRQLVGLLVLLAAFVVAAAVSPRIAPNVSKVATLSPEGTAGVAYLAAWAGTVILGAVVLHWGRAALDRAPRGGPVGRTAGALVGVVQASAVLALTLYAVLAAHLDGVPSATVDALRESRAARALVETEPRLRPALRLPGLVAASVEAVNDAVVGTSR